MNIWLLAPSIRPEAATVFAKWQARGYKVAAMVRPDVPAPEHCDRIIRADKYEGYPKAINRLWHEIANEKPDIVITGGDDLYPCEERTADELAADFFGRFPDGFGVMMLAKDDPGDGQSASNTWVGAEYARRINGGIGPYWPEYRHYYSDTEVGIVAGKLKAFWRRPDIRQLHDHWSTHGTERPAHLNEAAAGYAADRQLFESRHHAGFPGHEPLPKKIVAAKPAAAIPIAPPLTKTEPNVQPTR